MSLIGNPDTPASYVADYMQACVGMFGIPAGGFTDTMETYGAATAWNVESLYAAMLNSSIGRAIFAPGASNETLATTLVGKLGGSLLADADKAAAIDVVKAALDGGMSLAAVAMASVEFVAALETSDTTYGAVAQQFQNRIEIANYYTFQGTNPATSMTTLQAILSGVSNTTDVSDPSAVIEANTDPAVSTGETYTLTTNIDTINGTTGGDTIIGDSATLAAVDQLNGGAGVDTFKLVIDSTNAETVTFTNGEVILVTDTDATGDVTLGTNASLTKVGFVNNTAAATISNIASAVEVYVEGGSTGSNDIFKFVDSVVSGATDTVNVTLNSAKIADLQLIGATTGTLGFETVNITATGTGTTAGNTITTLKSGTTNIASKVTFAGSGDVTVTNALAATTTIDASASTGKIKVTTDTTKNVTFTGGSGNDTVYMAAGHDANDTLNGGAGTDTVGIADATDVDTTAEGSKITNFEVLDIIGSGVTNAYNMDYLSGITKITSSGALGANTTITNMTAATNVEVTADIGTYSLTINKKDANLSASDTLTLTVSSAASLTGTGTFDVNDIETLTLASTTTASGTITHTFAEVRADETTKLVVGADTTANLTLSKLQAKTLVELDASAATKAVSITMAAAIVGGANGASFTLGSGNDTLDLKAVTDFATATHDTTTTATVQLKGGAGADTFKIDAITTGEVFLFKYAAGDSVSESTATNGVSTTKTDTITDFITSSAYSDTQGMKFTIDTVESATAVSELNNTTGVVFGTTAVTNAYDFLVYHNGATTDWFVYQDTNGDKKIDSGEFAVKLVGATNAFAISEFAVTGGNLVYTSA